MALKDIHGLAVSAASHTSVERYDAALELFHGYYGDPVAAIDAALAEQPGFVMGHCLRAVLMLSATDANLVGVAAQAVAAAGQTATPANERERGHGAAARDWAAGDWESASRTYLELTSEFPRDALALQAGHLLDFFLGHSALLRDRIARALPHWDEDTPGFGFLLGMRAFGLEETGQYARAEESGRRALEINPRDPWAVHAVAHVFEMQGRQHEGIDWLVERAGEWAPDNAFAVHNWWHLALYHLDLGEIDRVLALYDQRIRCTPASAVLDRIDASAVLWRLTLRGIDVAERWNALADLWEPAAEDGFYAFNDCHAMLAFVGTGRDAAAQRLLESMRRRSHATGSNGPMTREVGLPLAQALLDFGHGNYASAAETLVRVRPVAQRFGGSNAQRDLLGLTLVEAALRDGQTGFARALAQERLDAKPSSPFNQALVVRTLAEPRIAERAAA